MNTFGRFLPGYWSEVYQTQSSDTRPNSPKKMLMVPHENTARHELAIDGLPIWVNDVITRMVLDRAFPVNHLIGN